MDIIITIVLGIALGVGAGYLLTKFLIKKQENKFNKTIVQKIKEQNVVCGIADENNKVKTIRMVDLLPKENVK